MPIRPQSAPRMRQSPNTQSAQTLPVSELEVNWHSHSKLNARASDQHYKYHVARMAKLYKEQGHKGAVDTSMPRTMAKPPPAVVESHKAHEYAVYGGDGAEAAGAGPSARVRKYAPDASPPKTGHSLIGTWAEGRRVWR